MTRRYFTWNPILTKPRAACGQLSRLSPIPTTLGYSYLDGLTLTALGKKRIEASGKLPQFINKN